ncbi:hypothetical protein C8J57DRAFT_1516761 [Mycena rebaudengoi]|nr:hypothetical protein C8J57DRAFT_1516761 [Mycena rebaudengoi]
MPTYAAWLLRSLRATSPASARFFPARVPIVSYFRIPFVLIRHLVPFTVPSTLHLTPPFIYPLRVRYKYTLTSLTGFSLHIIVGQSLGNLRGAYHFFLLCFIPTVAFGLSPLHYLGFLCALRLPASLIAR